MIKRLQFWPSCFVLHASNLVLFEVERDKELSLARDYYIILVDYCVRREQRVEGESWLLRSAKRRKQCLVLSLAMGRLNKKKCLDWSVDLREWKKNRNQLISHKGMQFGHSHLLTRPQRNPCIRT